jgi:hydrogenase-4 component B
MPIIDLVLWVIGTWMALGLLGIIALHRFALVARVFFPIGAVGGLVLAFASIRALGSGMVESKQLLLGLPQLPFHLRLDALSAYFLLVIGLASFGISLFAAGYFRAGEGTAPGLLCLEFISSLQVWHLF